LQQGCLRQGLVWNELYDRYGQPHVVARCCEQRLLDTPKIALYDSEALENLAVLMKSCLISLEEVSQCSTMNTVGFIASMAEKLPIELRRKWVTRALHVQREKKSLAGFAEFAQFVIDEADEANSTYSKAIFSPLSGNKSGGGQKKQRSQSFTTPAVNKAPPQPLPRKVKSGTGYVETGTRYNGCLCCSKPHKIEDCADFQRMSYRDRKQLVRDKALCFRCLRKGHILKDCRSRSCCEKHECKSTDHHTLMHFDRPSNNPAEAPALCSAASYEENVSSDSPAYLDIVPVCVRAGNSEVVTYALLDPGSLDQR